MNDAWRLICGVGLYRPASEALFEGTIAGAKQAQRELVRSWSDPKGRIMSKHTLEGQIRELEWDQSCFSKQEARDRERGRSAECLILEQFRSERRSRCEELRAEVAEIERELEALFAPMMEKFQLWRRHWVRQLMLAGGEDVQVCLTHLDRISVELAEERIRGLQASSEARVEAAANQAFEALRKSVGLKERDPEPADPWDWNRHRRRGGGGWNCA